MVVRSLAAVLSAPDLAHMANQRVGDAGLRGVSALAGVRRSTLALAVVLPWLLLVLLRLAENALGARLGGNVLSLRHVLASDGSIAVVGIAVTPVALWLALRFPLSKETWPRHLPILASAAVALALLMNLVRTQLWLWSGVLPKSAPLLKTALMAEAAAFHIDMINLAFIMSVAHLLLHVRDRQEKTLRAARLEAQLSEARMQTLQSQLQPHFLFNSLHTVGQLVRTQRSADAMKVVERLGDLLRTTLDERRPQLVTLADELRFARAYLEIEEIRFADRLRVDWQYEPAVECALVPPFLLQPLIENAVRHGIAPTASAGRLTISIDQRNGMLEIVVRDDGKGLRADLREGVGLRNTRERLETAFPGQAHLRIENAPGGGAEARVVIPFRTGPAQS